MYLVREEDIILSNIYINQLARLETIIYVTLLSGEVYRANNYVIWTVIHNLTIGGPVWAYSRIFDRAQYGSGSWKSMMGQFEGKPQMRKTK